MSSDDDPDDPEDLYLHYTSKEAQAWLLQSWQAYRNRGILPYAGGLANQPRVWTRAIQRLNGRYAPIFDRLLREKYPDRDKSSGEDLLSWIKGDGNGGSLFSKIGDHGTE